jgi:hypothetical protein
VDGNKGKVDEGDERPELQAGKVNIDGILHDVNVNSKTEGRILARLMAKRISSEFCPFARPIVAMNSGMLMTAPSV